MTTKASHSHTFPVNHKSTTCAIQLHLVANSMSLRIRLAPSTAGYCLGII